MRTIYSVATAVATTATPANTAVTTIKSVARLTALLICIMLLPGLSLSAETLVNTSAQKKCLQYQKKIDSYQRLRQKGGTGAQMEKWRKARKKTQEQWQSANCQRGGNHPQNSLGGKSIGG